MSDLLTLIPARGGSKGLPGKNLRSLAGLPLIGHSIRCASLCPEVGRIVVSTDAEEIAETARTLGAETPFLRPAELARDETPMWPVVRHALEALDPHGDRHPAVLLLDPTSPGRLPADVAEACARLEAEPEADGVVAVSEPGFNPIWHAVVERDGFVEHLFPEGRGYGRRQDLPRVLRINGALYLFRSEFVRREPETWLAGRLLGLEIPELRAFHIDDEDGLALCELVLGAGLVRLPWLEATADADVQ